MKKLYVGNLPFSATEDEVRELFEEHGSVASVAIITDRDTGRPRGFGFVEMEDGGEAAIQALDGKEMGGRNLQVNEARPRENRGGGGGGGGGRGGRGGSGGGGGGRRW
jgi:RNA recognition motif-containing protein